MGVDKTLFFHFRFSTTYSYDMQYKSVETQWESQFSTWPNTYITRAVFRKAWREIQLSTWVSATDCDLFDVYSFLILVPMPQKKKATHC